MVESKLRGLRPQPRAYAWFLLLAGWLAISSGVAMAPTWPERAFAVGWFLLPAIFTFILAKERRVASDCGAALASIVRLERRGRHRVRVYEYQITTGTRVEGKGSLLGGFALGMTVPVLYSLSKPSESVPVPDFLFYRVVAE